MKKEDKEDLVNVLLLVLLFGGASFCGVLCAM
jgi:hypothetical protein